MSAKSYKLAVNNAEILQISASESSFTKILNKIGGSLWLIGLIVLGNSSFSPAQTANSPARTANVPAQTAKVKFTDLQTIENDIRLAPCKNKEQAESVRVQINTI